MGKPIKVQGIEEPKFELEFPDPVGVVSYDPWKLYEDLEALRKQAKLEEREVSYDDTRRVFGMLAEADALEQGKFTFSRNQCIAICQMLEEFLAELPVSKKALSLLQNSATTSTSPSTK